MARLLGGSVRKDLVWAAGSVGRAEMWRDADVGKMLGMELVWLVDECCVEEPPC